MMRITNKGEFITNAGVTIPTEHAKAIFLNMKYRGKRWFEASPLHRLSREEAAYIYNNYIPKEILS